MTPNGAVLFAVVIVAAAVLSTGLPSLLLLLLVSLQFGALEVGRRLVDAIAWAAVIMLPLALFMAAVWVGIVGRTPADIAAGTAGSRAAAAVYVATISLRLYVIVFVIHCASLRFRHLTALAFIRELTAPLVIRKLFVLTVSLVDTILHAVDRARTALIAAAVITARPSLRNIANGFVLVQTVWLSVLTIATGRIREKWPIEQTLTRLDEALGKAEVRGLGIRDMVWIASAVAAGALALTVI
jgi:hypothetical protein